MHSGDTDIPYTGTLIFRQYSIKVIKKYPMKNSTNKRKDHMLGIYFGTLYLALIGLSLHSITDLS